MARVKKEPKNKEWLDLCEYVKREILQYDNNMKIPKYLVLKLQGLKKGQHIANNNIDVEACYDDYTILCAFKLCKRKIVDYLAKNETKIKDESHKINLIVKIPYGLQATGLTCPCDSPGKNTGVGCHAFLQGVSS